MLLGCTPDGVVAGVVAGPADTTGRWLADALCCWRDDPHGQPWTRDDAPPAHRKGGCVRGPTGPIWPRAGAPYLADDGFRGAAWSAHWRADYDATVLVAEADGGHEAAEARREHHRRRQVIETINGILEQTLHLHSPGARSFWGLRARLAAKLLALNLGIWLNTLLGRQPLALDTLFPT